MTKSTLKMTHVIGVPKLNGQKCGLTVYRMISFKDEKMAVLPTLPPKGTWLIDANMREASCHGFGRNMALPETITGFIIKSKTTGRGITNSKDTTWPILVILTTAPPDLQPVFLKKPSIKAQGLHRFGRERLTRSGAHGTGSRLMAMTRVTNSGLNKE